jgi:hypothetical protein
MSSLELDVSVWAQQQFGTCELGDQRRTRRAVKVAALFAADPDASTPNQIPSWRDLKGAYRLFESSQVTFEALAAPHWALTRRRPAGHYLLIGDTTTLDFGLRRKVEGLSPVGDGHGRGFLLHSSLMVCAETGEILGLAGQTIHHRQPVDPNETFRERLDRERETKIWGDVIRLIGPPPEADVRFTHVFDRGADNYEVFCHLVESRTDWVVRAAQLTRLIVTPAGERQQLQQFLETLAVAGMYELEVPATLEHPARTAHIEVRFSTVRLPAPRDCGRYVRECGIREIRMGVVEVREVDAPRDVEPLHWVLWTSHPLKSFRNAWNVITYYEQRPLVEEFHKAVKTGCRLERRQYRTSERLEALTGMLSVVAVRLLQLKTVARTTPDAPAESVVPRRWVTMLRRVSQGRHRTIETVKDFFLSLACLGGFLARKHDGEPGWIVLWRGIEKLHLLLKGADAMPSKYG